MKTVIFNHANQDYFIQEFTVCGPYEDDIGIDQLYVEDIDGNEVEDAMVLDAAAEYLQDNYGSELYEMWFEHRIGMAEYLRDSIDD